MLLLLVMVYHARQCVVTQLLGMQALLRANQEESWQCCGLLLQKGMTQSQNLHDQDEMVE